MQTHSLFISNIIIFDTYHLDISNQFTFLNKDIINTNTNNNKLPYTTFTHFFEINKHCISLYNNFMQRQITLFPIIRIFGSTPLGQKCCINIHNFYPFFYIELNNTNIFDYTNTTSLFNFASALETAYIKYRTITSLTKPNSKHSKTFSTQIIHNIIFENKKNVYGYYNKPFPFLKIECYNQNDIKHLMDLIHNGVLNGIYYQCYEAHISHSIHFFTKYKLCGMGLIKLKRFTFRYAIPKDVGINFTNTFTKYKENFIWKRGEDIQYSNSNSDNDHYIKTNEMFNVWDTTHVNKVGGVMYNTFAKSSKCEIEVDCVCDDIVVEGCNDGGNKEGECVRNSISGVIGNEVNLKNLTEHIKHCSSLIDFWKEEIERRSQMKLKTLTFENISNQNVYVLNENIILTQPNIAKELIINNFHIENNSTDIIINNSYQNVECFTIYEDIITTITDPNYIKQFQHDAYNKYKYFQFRKEHSDNLYENDSSSNSDDNSNNNNNVYDSKYKNDTKTNKLNISSSEDDVDLLFTKNELIISNESDNNSTNSDNNISYMSDNSNSNSTSSKELIKHFKHKRTFEERSFNLNSRKHIREIMNTKTIDECYNESDTDNNNNNTSSMNNKYSLLAKRNSFRYHNSNHINTMFNKLNDNVYIYCIMNVHLNKEIICNKLQNKHFYYDKNVNVNINNLCYSNVNDYKRFYKRRRKINVKRLRMEDNVVNKNNSLKMYIEQYNKIVKSINDPIYTNISNRRKRIDNIINKYKIYSQIYNDNNNNNNNVYIVKHYNILYINNWNRISYKDIYDKLQNEKQKQQNKKELNNAYFKNKYTSSFTTNNNDNNNNSNSYSTNINDTTIIKQTYFNEISPITEKKFKQSYSPFSLISSPFTPLCPQSIPSITSIYDKSLLITIMSIELLVNTTSNYGINPSKDEILCIFISIHDEHAKTSLSISSTHPYTYYNLIITSSPNKSIVKRYNNNSSFILSPEHISYHDNTYSYTNIYEVIYAKDEIGILCKLSEIILTYDPDIITSYESEKNGIGFIINRAIYLGYPLNILCSRVYSFLNEKYNHSEYLKMKIEEKRNENAKIENERMVESFREFKYLQMKYAKCIPIKGRIILNLWSVLESEIKLTDYSIENVIYNALQIRECQFEYRYLLSLYHSFSSSQCAFCLLYFAKRCKYNLMLINEYDLILRYSQFNKIYGIDLESSLTRGSQYKVEGVLSRISFDNNYVLLSASAKQRINQIPPQHTPIVIEPPKNIFYNPVIVLDFQSLYPSIMIAYNICYTTCLGTLIECLKDINTVNLNNSNNKSYYKKFGVYHYYNNIYNALKLNFNNTITNKQDIPQHNNTQFVEYVLANCTVTPNGTMYIKKHIQEGLLPIILKELLLTRIMIKHSMKLYDKESTIYKTLHNRQLGIKLLANVIYGYTSAGFSGRMPNSNIGDSIVALGKQIVTTTQQFIESNSNWNAKVIYGDTDSLFISIQNKSPIEAIEIGKEMATAITNNNPQPIKLQFEKVYCPLIFSSKKHYGGYKWESKEQIEKNEIQFDTKGIENVRRDSCKAMSKIIEKVIKILFNEKDLSHIKEYIFRSFDKIISGKVIISDFIFAKEVKWGKYHGNILPPSAQVAFNLYQKDPNSLPVYGQRIPFIIYNNQSGYKQQYQSVISPMEFFANRTNTICTDAYIDLIQKMLKRYLEPIDVDVSEWIREYKKPKSLGRNAYYYKNKTNNNVQREKEEKERNTLFKTKVKVMEDYFEYKKEEDNNGEDFEMKRFKYRYKVDLIVRKDEISKRLNKVRVVEKVIRKKWLMEKIKEINDVCKMCSGCNKFNLDIEDVPCVNYNCKLFYEKRLCYDDNTYSNIDNN